MQVIHFDQDVQVCGIHKLLFLTPLSCLSHFCFGSESMGYLFFSFLLFFSFFLILFGMDISSLFYFLHDPYFLFWQKKNFREKGSWHIDGV